MRIKRQIKIPGLERFEYALHKTTRELKALKPTCIIALARKGPRLLQIIKAIGLEIPEVPIITEHALDFIDKSFLGKNPIIFDDVVIVGSSLYHLNHKINDRFGLEPKVIAVFRDTDNFFPELVPKLVATQSQTEADVQEFSSEIIRAIPLLGLPYDVDHPIFSYDRVEGLQIFKELCAKATLIHREHLSLQYANDSSLTVIHFQLPESPSISQFSRFIGSPEIFKLKVFDSRHLDEIRIVSVGCFPVLRKDYLQTLWEHLSLPPEIKKAAAKYRVMCFSAACAFAEAIHPKLVTEKLLWDEVTMNMVEQGIASVKQLKDSLSATMTDTDVNTIVLSPVSDEEASAFGEAFGNAQELLAGIDNYEEMFGKICLFWRNVFRKIELGFRQILYKDLQRGIPIEDIMSSPCSKRLSSGFTLREFFNKLKLDAVSERSLALDLAVDSGVQVPIYTETPECVARVYHHGENVWDGDRLASLISAAFSELQNTIRSLPIITFEKYMVLLYELAENLKVPVFSTTVHYLQPPKMQLLTIESIEVDIGWEAHGSVLEVKSLRKGVNRDGSPRRITAKPSVYWLLDKSAVFKSNSRGKGISLNVGAVKEYLATLAISKKTLGPVKMLFKYLTDYLPENIIVGSKKKTHNFDKDDIFRFLSSCVHKKQYLHAISQDALLLAQEFFGGSRNATFWRCQKCRILSGEIYMKWLVRFFKDEIWRTIHNHALENGVDDRFDVVIEPLNPAHDANNYRGENKIEDRCIILMLCIESLAVSEGKQISEEKRRALNYLQESGYTLPDSNEDKIKMATLICEEIIDMFPTLLNELESIEHEQEIEYFLFSDMRDSSVPEESAQSEKAKEELRNTLVDMNTEGFRFHVNDDLNDEKDVYAVGEDLVKAVMLQIIRKYSAHGKYARIGIVSSTDTLESANMLSSLPSSPTNYALAKKIAHCLRDSEQESEKSFDLRHTKQKHGIIVVSAQPRSLFEESDVLPKQRKCATVNEFMKSNKEGWIHICDKNLVISGKSGPEIKCSVFLYR